MKELGEGLRITKEIGTQQEDPTESTNLDPWELSKTELPTKEHTRAEAKSHYTYVADVQLGVHVCLELELRAIPKTGT